MKKLLNVILVLMTLAFTSTVFAEIVEDIRVECKDLDGKKMCKPIKVDAPVDEGFKLMKDIRVDKTMVDGKAVYKTININKSASQDDKALVPGGKLLDLGINFATYEPIFIPLAAPVFGVAAIASFADPDAAAWVNGAAADILDTEKVAEDWVVNAVQFWKW
jgi:hypothetical protein